jgi:hypothetical protein
MLRRVALKRTSVSEERITSFIEVKIIGELGTTLVVISNRSTLVIEVIVPAKTEDLTRATRRNIPEDAILHSHRRGNLKSYITEINSLNVNVHVL